MIKEVIKEDNVATSTGYTGNVTLIFKKGKNVVKSVKIKNQGTLRLFQGIALGLVTKNINDISNYYPAYMGIGYTSLVDFDITSNALVDEFAGKRVPLNSHNIKQVLDDSSDPVGWIAPFSAIFTYSSISNEPFNELGLFATKDTDTLLARIKLPSVETLPVGMSLIVQ